MKKQQSITERLRDIVKKKNTPLVIIKAGSIRRVSRTSGGDGYEGDYYQSYYDE